MSMGCMGYEDGRDKVHNATSPPRHDMLTPARMPADSSCPFSRWESSQRSALMKAHTYESRSIGKMRIHQQLVPTAETPPPICLATSKQATAPAAATFKDPIDPRCGIDVRILQRFLVSEERPLPSSPTTRATPDSRSNSPAPIS